MKSLIIIANLVAFTVFLPACSKKEKLNLTVTVDSLSISFPAKYQSFDYYISPEKKAYYSIYNELDSSIKITDLETQAILSVKVPHYLNTDFDDLTDYSIHNFDSIFLQFFSQVMIIDTAGKVKYRYVINNPFSEKWPDTIRNSLGSLFHMNYEKTGTLSLQQYSGKYYSWSQGYYKVPVVSLFSLKDSTFSNVSVFYPKKYSDSYYGELNHIYRAVTETKEIFSFEADENIYIFDKQTRNVKQVQCKSFFDTIPIKPLPAKYSEDINRKMDHLTTNSCYLKIIYDPYRNLYYRFFSAGVPLKNSDGTYNTSANKPLFLMVMDAKFNVIKELPISKNEWYWSFVSPKGLYLQKILPHTKNTLKNVTKVYFDVFNFTRN